MQVILSVADDRFNHVVLYMYRSTTAVRHHRRLAVQLGETSEAAMQD